MSLAPYFCALWIFEPRRLELCPALLSTFACVPSLTASLRAGAGVNYLESVEHLDVDKRWLLLHRYLFLCSKQLAIWGASLPLLANLSSDALGKWKGFSPCTLPNYCKRKCLPSSVPSSLLEMQQVLWKLTITASKAEYGVGMDIVTSTSYAASCFNKT